MSRIVLLTWILHYSILAVPAPGSNLTETSPSFPGDETINATGQGFQTSGDEWSPPANPFIPEKDGDDLSSWWDWFFSNENIEEQDKKQGTESRS